MTPINWKLCVRSLLLLGIITTAFGCASASAGPTRSKSKSRVYVPQDPHEVGIPAPYQELTEAAKLEAAVAALGAAGLDVSAFNSAAFVEGSSTAIFVGVPWLREEPDGSFVIAPSERVWGWEVRTPIVQLQLAFGAANWNWETEDMATLVIGPMTMSSTQLGCDSGRGSGSPEPEGIYYERAPHEADPKGYLFEAEPTLYVLPKRDHVEVLYAVQRHHMIIHPTDCFMVSVATTGSAI